MVAPRRLYNLKRPKIRQSWNKYNLYNLIKEPTYNVKAQMHRTFFQQKWRAKGMLRAYHGAHVVERKWERMFDRRLLSVVDMQPKTLAGTDGSEFAAGRGIGREKLLQRKSPTDRSNPTQRTPYMQMTFAPMERRLDIAVFRAMFATSTRQSRQFCIHGAVKVNGHIMRYPAYRLNPGDMFQVDPERVMWATGRPHALNGKKKGSGSSAPRADDEAAEQEVEEAASEEAQGKDQATATPAQQESGTTDPAEPARPDMAPTREEIKILIDQAKGILNKGLGLNVAQKQNIRSFIKDARPLLARSGRSTATPQDIGGQLSAMLQDLKIKGPALEEPPSQGGEKEVNEGENQLPEEEKEEEEAPVSADDLSAEETKILSRLIRESEENPYDPTKSYRTPWAPREWMSAFAFIPQYLEVNPKICSAVYLRHPVARPGAAEVPTPYSEEVNQLAFNWYLKRR